MVLLNAAICSARFVARRVSSSSLPTSLVLLSFMLLVNDFVCCERHIFALQIEKTFHLG